MAGCSLVVRRGPSGWTSWSLLTCGDNRGEIDSVHKLQRLRCWWPVRWAVQLQPTQDVEGEGPSAREFEATPRHAELRFGCMSLSVGQTGSRRNDDLHESP